VADQAGRARRAARGGGAARERAERQGVCARARGAAFVRNKRRGRRRALPGGAAQQRALPRAARRAAGRAALHVRTRVLAGRVARRAVLGHGRAAQGAGGDASDAHAGVPEGGGRQGLLRHLAARARVARGRARLPAAQGRLPPGPHRARGAPPRVPVVRRPPGPAPRLAPPPSAPQHREPRAAAAETPRLTAARGRGAGVRRGPRSSASASTARRCTAASSRRRPQTRPRARRARWAPRPARRSRRTCGSFVPRGNGSCAMRARARCSPSSTASVSGWSSRWSARTRATTTAAPSSLTACSSAGQPTPRGCAPPPPLGPARAMGGFILTDPLASWPRGPAERACGGEGFNGSKGG
jgi:hypothetical protein